MQTLVRSVANTKSGVRGEVITVAVSKLWPWVVNDSDNYFMMIDCV